MNKDTAKKVFIKDMLYNNKILIICINITFIINFLFKLKLQIVFIYISHLDWVTFFYTVVSQNKYKILSRFYINNGKIVLEIF